MCGIYGTIADHPCRKDILESLRLLEYRGYDSTGICLIDENHQFNLVKKAGTIDTLEKEVPKLSAEATVGMGHTRWATHGPATDQNAHPHVSGDIALVHNGIIENIDTLKEQLTPTLQLQSETDSEVLACLLNNSQKPKEDLFKLVRKLKGTFSLGVLFLKEPTKFYVVKKGSPLILGFGTGGVYFSSDKLALMGKATEIIHLDDFEIAVLERQGADIFDLDGRKKIKARMALGADQLDRDKKGFDHYMLKEIHEQPRVCYEMIQRFLDEYQKGSLDAFFQLEGMREKKFRKVHILGCGTAYYAGVLFQYQFEKETEIPCMVELASEFRSRRPSISEDDLVIAFSQSGETMDTLEAIKFANNKRAFTYVFCNVEHSSIARECDGVFYLGCGPEIGVASTKAFSAMVLASYLFCKAFRRQDALEFREKLLKLPSLAEATLGKSTEISQLAVHYKRYEHFIYIGRGLNAPLAFEGALKLKEISYIHGEGYPAGELKHGPIALIDPDKMPVLAIAPNDGDFAKIQNSVAQIAARRGKVLCITTEDVEEQMQSIAEDVLVVPQIGDDHLQVFLSALPLQLFAYHVAILRGTNVDQPRNLAKSVTVE